MRFASLNIHRASCQSAVAKAWPRVGRRAGGIAFGTSEREQAQRNALLAFVVRVASAAIAFMSQVAIARWMGGHDYGVYVYAWTWVLVLGGLATLGFNVTAIRLVSQYRATGDFASLRGLLLGGRLQTLAVATASSGAFGLMLWQLDGRLTAAHVVALAMLAVPAFALTDVQDAICRGNARLVSATFPPYILRPLMILAGLGMMHGLGFSMTAESAIMVAVLATWIAYAAQTVIVERHVVADVAAGPRIYHFKTWLTTSMPLLSICACELALQNTDVIVISHLLSPTEAGVYFAAAKTMGLIMFVYYAVGSAMANRFAAMSALGDAAALQVSVLDAVRWTFWPSLAVGLVMLAAGQPLLSMFGPQFADGYPVMGVLVVAFIVRAAIGPVDFLLNMSGGQAACAKSLAIAAVLNLVLNLALVPVAGIMGAAVAVAVSLITGTLLNYRVACRRLGFDIGIWAAYQRPAA